MLISVVFVLVLFIRKAATFPYLSNEAKEDLDKSSRALINMRNHLGKTISSLETDNSNLTNFIKLSVGKQLKTAKSALVAVDSKIRTVYDDFKALGKDLKKSKWHKYNGHCYYYGTTTTNWFNAERNCKEMGGYLAQVTNAKENTELYKNMPSRSYYYWIGLTDLVEGQYRWSYDQTLSTYKPWYSSYGKRGSSYNCVAMLHSGYNGLWIDYPCSSSYYYICESNFCY